MPDAELIVQIAWQSAAWLAVGLIAARWLDTRPARAHAVLLFAAVAAIATPVLTVVFGNAGWGLFEARGFSTRTAAATPASFDTFAPIATGVNWWGWALGAWAVLTGLLVVRFGASFMRAAMIVRRSTSVGNDTVTTALDRALRQTGLTRSVRVCESDHASGPMIWCWGQPTIVLPADDAERCATLGVLCHELAHWRRRDHVASFIGEMIVILLPWNPLSWAVRTRLSELSERACDAWALESGEGAADYAETLVGLSPMRLATAPAAGSRGSALRRRVARILQERPTDPRAGKRWTVGVCAAVLAGSGVIALAQERAPNVHRHAVEHATETPVLDELLVDEAFANGLMGVVSPNEIDFGVVGRSCVDVQQAVIWNRGDKAIEVLEVVPSCGCTQIEGFEPGTLAPGAVMEIDVYMTAPEAAGVVATRHLLVKIKGQPTIKLPIKIQSDGLDC